MSSKVKARPKNFGEILTTAKELLRYMAESDEKSWHEKYEAMWTKKLDELANLVFASDYLAEYLSFRDLQDVFFNIVLSTGKDVKAITNEDLEAFLDKLLTNPETYEFYFPAIDLFNFPEDYALGVCVLHSFPQLPHDAQKYISSTWKFDYDKDKATYYVRSMEEYEVAKRKETYFCLEVYALGFFCAIEKATKLANQAVKILKCFYLLHDFLPNLGKCYYTRSRGGQGGQTPYPRPQRLGGYSHQILPEIEKYLQVVNEFAKKGGNDDIGRRCLSALEIYGMIERETPVELKFLLSVIATEGLLLDKDDKDFLGWKMREKVAVLLGDTPVWMQTYLKKVELTSQDYDSNRLAARVDLARKVGRMYDKRSRFAHQDEETRVEEDDFHFASMVFRFALQKIVSLYSDKGIRRVRKESPVDLQSLDGLLESLKYSVPLG